MSSDKNTRLDTATKIATIVIAIWTVAGPFIIGLGAVGFAVHVYQVGWPVILIAFIILLVGGICFWLGFALPFFILFGLFTKKPIPLILRILMKLFYPMILVYNWLMELMLDWSYEREGEQKPPTEANTMVQAVLSKIHESEKPLSLY
jgi:CBS domain containing-hemolysin-like protein